jgi:SAM-dependent methyltransferase
MTNFKDLFSIQASDYAKFRPNYPESLFTYLASIAPTGNLVWDCGTGNGQAAVKLATHFHAVTATDPSEKQLLSAEKNSRVTYKQASAEEAPFQDKTVDLITAAQAFHWFKHEQFFREVKRVLKPQGVLAIWSYNLCEITPTVDEIVRKFYGETLGPYWEKERRLVEEGYRNCIFPMTELTAPRFEMKAEWSFEHFIGYLSTWSSVQTYIKKNGENPVEKVAPALKEAWGNEKTLSITWELSTRIGRV